MGFAPPALQPSPHMQHRLCKGTDVCTAGQGPKDESHGPHEEAENIRTDPHICPLCLSPLYLPAASREDGGTSDSP